MFAKVLGHRMSAVAATIFSFLTVITLLLLSSPSVDADPTGATPEDAIRVYGNSTGFVSEWSGKNIQIHYSDTVTWDFGDGTESHYYDITRTLYGISISSASHTFEDGAYLISVTVEDSDGNIRWTDSGWFRFGPPVVSFVSDGEVLMTVTVSSGSTVSAPEDPSKETDEAYTYTFAGWEGYDPEMRIDKDYVFTAVFDKTLREYLIEYYSENNLFFEDMRPYGSPLGMTWVPEKDSDIQYDYAFVGWNTEKDGTGAWYDPTSAVSGPLTLYAVFDRTPIEYCVSIYVDGEEASCSNYVYGDILNLPDNPSKTSDNKYTYPFKGWNSKEDGSGEWYDGSSVVTGDMSIYAVFEKIPVEYTISYFADGQPYIEKTQTYGEYLDLPPKPEKDADVVYTYTFSGWNSREDGSGEWYDGSSVVTGDMSIYAVFEKTLITYHISFYANGGPYSEKDQAYGDLLDLPPPPSKDTDVAYTYSFKGWNISEDGLGAWYDGSSSVTEDLTLYAIFERTAIEYTIAYFSDGQPYCEKTQTYGENLEMPESPIKSNDVRYTYTFIGWNSKEDGSGDWMTAIDSVTGDMAAYAVFERTAIEYTIAYYSDGTLYRKSVQTYGEYLDLPPKPAKDADVVYIYTFSGWNSKEDGSGEWYDGSSIVTGNMSIYAVFEKIPIRYTIGYHSDGQPYSEKTQTYGEPLDIPPSPSKDADLRYTYSFKGWNASEDGLGAWYDGSSSVTEDLILYAIFERTAIEYTIGYYSDGDLYREFVQTYGESIRVPDSPSKDADVMYTYAFSGWNSKEDGSGEWYDGTEIVTGHLSLYAVFDCTPIRYAISYHLDRTLYDEKIQTYGESLDVPLPPSKEQDIQYIYSFIGWNTCGDGGGKWYDASDRVDGDLVLYAVFDMTIREYTVRYYSEGTVVFEETCKYGEGATFPKDPTKDSDIQYSYSFIGWNMEKDGSGDYPPTGFPVSGEISLYAVFLGVLREYDVTYCHENEIIHMTQEYGSEIRAVADPCKDADMTYTYSFVGWNTCKDGTGTWYYEGMTVSGEIVFYAIFDPAYIPYLVVFLSEGKTVSEMTQTYGEKISSPRGPVKDPDVQYSYSFTGWNTDPSGKGEWLADVPSVTGDLTFYAVFCQSLREYTITFVSGDDVTCMVSEYGSPMPAPLKDPSKSTLNDFTYEFMGWNTAEDATGRWYDRDMTVSCNIVFYAKFTAKCQSTISDIVTISVGDMDDEGEIVASGYSGWTITFPAGILVEDHPTLAVSHIHDFGDMSKDVRVALSNKTVYSIELSVSIAGNTLPITVRLPYDGNVDVPVHSFYIDGSGNLVDNGEAELVFEDGKTYAVFITPHFSTWAVGPEEDGDHDPAEEDDVPYAAFAVSATLLAIAAAYIICFLRKRSKDDMA
ncbi:InlB B-repeat-containing protein [Methanomethylophilus alvi]|uniref:InlB B-repeat-containing protein n=1 Tax=Methanomethylophilus alvi TaxID=1291540 RepID=UPI0037DC2B22